MRKVKTAQPSKTKKPKPPPPRPPVLGHRHHHRPSDQKLFFNRAPGIDRPCHILTAVSRKVRIGMDLSAGVADDYAHRSRDSGFPV
jgi:hypothetical protein